jgi:hypothetical protein
MKPPRPVPQVPLSRLRRTALDEWVSREEQDLVRDAVGRQDCAALEPLGRTTAAMCRYALMAHGAYDEATAEIVLRSLSEGRRRDAAADYCRRTGHSPRDVARHLGLGWISGVPQWRTKPVDELPDLRELEGDELDDLVD